MSPALPAGVPSTRGGCTQSRALHHFKLLTGSQFPKMRAALAGKTAAPQLELKSRDGRLFPKDDEALELFIR
jgi:hypothetical protein